MFEKVNPSHPDKVADRIAGAIVDLAYKKNDNPKIAVEVLIGHGNCHIITETSVSFETSEIEEIVHRIADNSIKVDYSENQQDRELARNQETLHCGDNGIFKGVPSNYEEGELSNIAKKLYAKFPYDGKYIINGNTKIICQSNAKISDVEKVINPMQNIWTDTIINPLGYWTGGVNVDCGATNRKLGSDMGRAATGGGLHGKDLSKADVSVNIWCNQMAKLTNHVVEAYCSIGDRDIMVTFNGGETFIPYPFSAVVAEAECYISRVGGFEKFAEWGLI